MNTANIYVNQAPVSFNELPWGGIKNSGYGRDNGREGLEAFALVQTRFNKHK